MITVAIHQPNFLPWLGYLDKWDRADRFVLLDRVQLARRSNTVRVQVLQNGRALTLSLPIKHTGSQELSIADALLDEPARSGARVAATLRHAYGRCTHFAEIGDPVCAVLEKAPARLLDLNLALLEVMGRFAGLDCGKLLLQSSLPHEGQKSLLMASLTRSAGGGRYLSGGHAPTRDTIPGAQNTAADYNDPAVYAQAGVELVYQNFRHPVYPQSTGAFVSGLSAFDALARLGAQALTLTRDANGR